MLSTNGQIKSIHLMQNHRLSQKQNKTKQKVGGNVHESWSLLRFSPLIIGPLVPEDAPAWHFVLDLKDIVEIVVAPVNSDEYILYLDHYLEHKPVLIWLFGPL